MKVLIATPLYPPDIGGPATYVKLLEEGLPPRGIEVELVKFGDVRHLPNVIRQVAYCINVFRKAKNADIILSLDAVSVGWPAYFANLFLRKKFVVKIVGDHIWEQGKQRFGIKDSLDDFPRFSWQWHPYLWFLRALQFLTVRGSNKIIVPSNYLKGIVTAWGIPPEKIEVIYNAVPLGTIGVVPQALKSLPRPFVVVAGRLVPWKHVDRVIDAAWSMRRQGKVFSLIVVGDGPDRKKLEAHARHLLKKNFFFTGELSHPDTLAVLGSSDIFILNSSYEGLSHVLIEAMGLGIPCIVTDAGGNSEVAIRNSSIMVKLNDTVGLTSSLEFLISNAEERSRLSAAAKESAKRFSVEAMMSKTALVLKSI
jgi:glycosyltransferase involved in cell wall biosynthesis